MQKSTCKYLWYRFLDNKMNGVVFNMEQDKENLATKYNLKQGMF
jgi:hypothetical protein